MAAPRRDRRSSRRGHRRGPDRGLSGHHFQSRPIGADDLDQRALGQRWTLHTPDRVADPDATAPVGDGVDKRMDYADMLHGAFVQQWPIAVEGIFAQIFDREKDRGERQQAEPDQLPLPTYVKPESNETGHRCREPEPHEENARRHELEHEQHRSKDHPAPGAKMVKDFHGRGFLRYTDGTEPAPLRGCVGFCGGSVEFPPEPPKASRAISATPAIVPSTEVASI